MLGDSFTFGEGVPDEETFVARLDAALRGEGLQVLNAGVAGHGTVEEAARGIGQGMVLDGPPAYRPEPGK